MNRPTPPCSVGAYIVRGRKHRPAGPHTQNDGIVLQHNNNNSNQQVEHRCFPTEFQHAFQGLRRKKPDMITGRIAGSIGTFPEVWLEDTTSWTHCPCKKSNHARCARTERRANVDDHITRNTTTTTKLFPHPSNHSSGVSFDRYSSSIAFQSKLGLSALLNPVGWDPPSPPSAGPGGT